MITTHVRALAAAATCGIIMLFAQAVMAQPAEIKVLSAGAMRRVMTELTPHFERATGDKLQIQYGEIGALKRQIDSGGKFDVVILSGPLLDDLVKEGKIAAGTRTDIARAGLGVIMRTGASKPDISTVDAFKRTMLNAKSFAYPKEGAPAAYVPRLFDRLGMSDEMKPKLLPASSASEAVAKGEAELGVVVISALGAVPGIELVAPLPAELQNYVGFTAGVSASANESARGRALIDFLRAPAAIPVLKANGMEPVTP